MYDNGSRERSNLDVYGPIEKCCFAEGEGVVCLFLSSKIILRLFSFHNEKQKGKAIIEKHGCNNLPVVSSKIFPGTLQNS